MHLSPNNFLYLIKQTVTGGLAPNTTGPLPADGGFNLDAVLSLAPDVPGASATVVNVNNTPVLSSAASQTTIGTWSFPIGRDYDEAGDQIRVRLLARSAGATNTPTLTVNSFITALGGTVGVAGTIVVGTAITATEAAYEFNLSGQGLVRDSVLSFNVVAGAHTTDAVQIFAVEVTYASCLVSFRDGLDALGNPLR